MHSTPAFIARLLPIFSLKSDVLMERLTLLLETIHDAGGFVFFAMTESFGKPKDVLIVKGPISPAFSVSHHPPSE